jgi:hypothetical protein
MTEIDETGRKSILRPTLQSICLLYKLSLDGNSKVYCTKLSFPNFSNLQHKYSENRDLNNSVKAYNYIIPCKCKDYL